MTLSNIEQQFLQASRAGDLLTIQQLIADHEDPCFKENIVFRSAISSNQPKVVAYLIEQYQLDVDWQNGLLLCLAIKNRAFEVVDVLLQAGADPSLDDEYALYWAGAVRSFPLLHRFFRDYELTGLSRHNEYMSQLIKNPQFQQLLESEQIAKVRELIETYQLNLSNNQGLGYLALQLDRPQLSKYLISASTLAKNSFSVSLATNVSRFDTVFQALITGQIQSEQELQLMIKECQRPTRKQIRL